MKSHVPKLSYRKFFSWAFALALLLGAVAFFWSSAARAGDAKPKGPPPQTALNLLEDMGRIAYIYSHWIQQGASASIVGNKLVFTGPGITNGVRDGKTEISADSCIEDEDCQSADPDFPGGVPIPGGQAEYAIAVDSTGQHIVVGFNDTRGFSLNPTSVSGFYYSDDGGVTFVDGGQLPIPVAVQSTIGTTKLPQVFGDADIKYFGGSIFIYSSIFVKNNNGAVGQPATQQTMCIHRSTDFGHTWQGPFEVTTATRPTTVNDVADKEFIDINPSTGRLIVQWSNFINGGSGGVEELSAFSDNAATANPPTWSVKSLVYAANPATYAGGSGQGIMPKFKGDATTVYSVTGDRNRSFDPADTSQYQRINEMFFRSTDQGVTWSAGTSLSGDFRMPDRNLGNDRDHSFPSIAVDRSGTATAGNIYVVWDTNASLDAGDIAFVRSTDNGLTFTAGTRRLNSRPGNDRGQWFPTVAVDNTTGRVVVTYYDEGLANSGQLCEIAVQSSTDGGLNFSKPVPLNFEPFKAGWGNDTGQPNLGDYNMTVAQGGELFSAHAATELKPFGDGELALNDSATGSPGSMTTPDLFFRRTTLPARPSLRMANYSNPQSGGFGAIKITDSGGNGFIDPGDTVNFEIALQNYVTNTALTTPPSTPASVTGISATISTTTPGVTFTSNTATYPAAAAGATSKNSVGTFVAQISNSFVPGTPIKLTLTVTTGQGTAVFTYTQPTGTPRPVVLLSENFDDTIPGGLPAGWSNSHVAGSTAFPWSVNSTVFREPTAPNNSVFQPNNAGGTRTDRLFSPLINIPANCEYVTIDLDVVYNSEDDPNYRYLGYDGFLLRVFDNTAGRNITRSIQVEAFEEEFTTGEGQFYPKAFPRGSASFRDLSAWTGFSNGFKHVHMKLPATELTPTVSAVSLNGAQVQLRFEYEQDGGGIGSDIRPLDANNPARATSGVAFDNLVVSAVTSAPAGAAQPNSSPTPTPTATPSQLVNVSTRARVESGTGNEIIGGFIIQGSGTKNVIIRGLGPSLQNMGLSDFLVNPTLELRSGASVLATNQDWRDTQEAAIKATGIPPLYDVESAIVASLAPGNYSVLLRGLGGGTGLGLIEVYDLATGATTKLANLSTRASVKTGNNVMIGGFFVDAGSGGANVAVRALGPSLTAFGVPGALPDPTLELRDGDGTLLLANDDWQDNAGQAAALTAAGMAPSNAKESAVIKFLTPGAYTAIVQGRNGTPTGVGLVEIYNLP
ncbi:MAG: hypothetical protein QOG51_878 [Verrucomicrobiota bacterium]